MMIHLLALGSATGLVALSHMVCCVSEAGWSLQRVGFDLLLSVVLFGVAAVLGRLLGPPGTPRLARFVLGASTVMICGSAWMRLC